MEIEVEVKQAKSLKDLDEFLDNAMTVEEFAKMRVESAIERAKKTLVLPLKRKWFDMIKSGEKLEEYREIKPHYIGLLFDRREMLDCMGLCSEAAFEEKHLPKPFMFAKHFDTLVFTLGYPKAEDTERRLVFKNPRIRIGTGKPEWGAEPGKLYFVITWL